MSVLDEIRKRAETAARQLDEKYDVKAKVDRGVRAASDAARVGAETASATFDFARGEVVRVDQELKISETVGATAKQAAKAAEEVARKTGALEVMDDLVEGVTDTAKSAKAATGDLFGGARKYYESAAGAARAGTSAVRLPSSVLDAALRGRRWMKENPGKAAVISLAFIAGTRAGSAFSSLDVTLLGAGGAGNWLFHSAIVPFGLRKLSGKYEDYLKGQEQLLRDGKLDDAEQSRVKFQRDVAKYVGAPLLGTFSIAAGAGLIYEGLTGGVVTGFPIGLVLGGNPLLSSIWLFGNGLVCLHTGYSFFMMALGDQEDVARVVRDIKGLLSPGAPA